ncbi:MAG: hypothetical protein ACXACH_01100 [Candidatus Hermodarchaeia archaeon]|jgi:FMN phosphatase YigB (HAD superfamily)
MKLAALDCDGTLIYSNGPLNPVMLRQRGYFTVLVSLSRKCLDKEGFDDIIPSHADDGIPSKLRKQSLIRVKEKYTDAEEYVYISDNLGDDVISLEVGFRHVHPNDLQEFLDAETP